MSLGWVHNILALFLTNRSSFYSNRVMISSWESKPFHLKMFLWNYLLPSTTPAPHIHYYITRFYHNNSVVVGFSSLHGRRVIFIRPYFYGFYIYKNILETVLRNDSKNENIILVFVKKMHFPIRHFVAQHLQKYFVTSIKSYSINGSFSWNASVYNGYWYISYKFCWCSDFQDICVHLRIW